MISDGDLFTCATGGTRKDGEHGAGSWRPAAERVAGRAARGASRPPAPAPDASDTAPDASSDVDVSESLPHDGPSPALPSPPAVYAVVKKSAPAMAQQPLSSIPPRSPANIPLIRISQTESVERAERAPPQRQPAIVDDAPPRRLPRQVTRRSSRSRFRIVSGLT